MMKTLKNYGKSIVKLFVNAADTHPFIMQIIIIIKVIIIIMIHEYEDSELYIYTYMEREEILDSRTCL